MIMVCKMRMLMPPLVVAISALAAVQALNYSIPEDAQVLLAIKQSFDSFSLDDWSSGHAHFCNWSGVICDKRNQSVVGLNLQNKSLSGTIPPLLGNLHHLATLNLSYNSLTGAIPKYLFASSSTLSSLSLARNNLSGTIPPDIFNCTALNHIDFSFNNLRGFIPPRLSLLSNLQHLNFRHNNFQGPIPTSLSNCTNLVVLDLCVNFLLNGSMPVELGRLTRLQNLCVDVNDLTGIIPPAMLSNLTQLRVLMIGNNRMSGTIPPVLGQMRYLEELFIECGHFEGTIPSVLGNISSLRVLALYNNSLTGTIPKSLGQLSQLNKLSIRSNSLTGSLPPELGNLTKLDFIRVRNNFLTGSIPAEYGRLTRLTEFSGQMNHFTGRIPSELGNCSILALLRLDSNQLSGHIPEELGRLTQLGSLYLDHNDLTGTIPESLSNCTNLQDLSLGYNRLQGTIPLPVASLRNIVKSFSMPHNLLTGNIPTELGGMALVTTMDLAGNLLNGTIPHTIGSCVELLHLNLSHNKLHGQIPTTLASLVTLNDLDVSSNDLSGPIPQYLANMTTLTFLNVSYNRLSGPIPDYGLFLNLTPNSFSGNAKLCGQIIRRECPPISHSGSSSGLSKGSTIAIIIGAFGLAAVVITASLCFCIIYRRRTIKAKNDGPHLALSERGKALWKMMTMKDLLEATADFNDKNIIGSGRTATVYRGSLRDGKEIAVKRLKDDSIDQLNEYGQLDAELGALWMTRHRNLVSVLGWFIGAEMRALVLEMMPNGTLAAHIQNRTLEWKTAVRIALGIANGLKYLHHEGLQPILHCDLKPTNILLDFDFKPAIADFGLSRILKYGDMTRGFSTSNMRGSIGYMAPEYAGWARITAKADVYSYGIVVLEMVSGISPTSEMLGESVGITLPNWVEKGVKENNPLRSVADQFLKGASKESLEEIVEMLELGLACTAEMPQNRPTMKEVVRVLENKNRG